MKQKNTYKFFWQYLLLAVSLIMVIASFIMMRYVIDKASLANHAVFFENEIKTQVNDFRTTVLNDSILVKRLLTVTERKDDMMELWHKPYYFFLYKDSKEKDFLRFWNTSQVLPPNSILNNDEQQEMFAKLSNGYYYIFQERLPQDSLTKAYCMLLIKSEYFIPTDYLKESYPFDKSINNIASISFTPTANPVKSISGKVLFYLKQKPGVQLFKDNTLSITLRIIGLFLFFIAVYLLLHEKFTKQNLVRDIYVFVACMLAFRITLYILGYYTNFESFGLFNSAMYDSGLLLHDLGDLLINSILFCCIAAFIWYRSSAKEVINVKKISSFTSWLYGVFMILILVMGTFTLATVIKSLVAQSNISFDVTNFFSLSIYTVVGFIILAAIALGFYYASRFLFKYLIRLFKDRAFYVYIIIAVIGLLYTTFVAPPPSVSFYIPCLLWLLLYTAFFFNEHHINSVFTINITGVIVWIFIFSISISMLMLSEIRSKELVQRKRYVQKLATQNDEASTRVIGLSNKFLDNHFFINNFQRFEQESTSLLLRDSIVRSSYISYQNNYTTKLFLFDSLNAPIFNTSDLTLESLNTIIETQSKPTAVPDMFLYETGIDKFSYITRRVIYDSKGKFYGTVIILSDPKRFAHANINADLFKQYSHWELSHPSVYYYAVYKNKLLVSSTKQYPFTSTLIQSEVPEMRYEQRRNEGYGELWYKPNPSTVIVMARKSEPLLETITLFSYIFCAFLVLLTVLNLLILLLDRLLKFKFFKSKSIFQSTIRGQIHNTFILITVLSFVVVGVATISFVTDRFRIANNERLSHTMNVMLNELQMRSDIVKLVYRERLDTDTVDFLSELNGIVKEVSDIHGMDANVYDIGGDLIASSLPDLYQRGIISTRMEPRAYYNLLRLRSIEHIQPEAISDLSYTSIYTPFRDQNGALFGYLGVPYFTAQHQLNQEISNFLVTLINLNTFIFLITGLVALFITNRITRSFKLISDKMNAVTFTKNNELIEWNRDDEIGSLVNEYNRMVTKLQQSAAELASAERQSAWQEMAQQVAHEIKNPLTPMKLSLQYLQRAIDENRKDIEKLTANVSKTLVEQIDHLSKIATDFSRFANIGTVNNEYFDLNDAISQLHALHRNNPNVDIEWNQLETPLLIYADKTQVNRLFTNLLVNSIDAKRENQRCMISIYEEVDDEGFVVVSVQDNGTGIGDEMKNKIFQPNFTTKTSGTGLGLAMTKAIVEQMGGAIWFDTMMGKGTTFYIKLPLASL
ncbi:MAG: sensor histidine kinase [Niabella sp.]